MEVGVLIYISLKLKFTLICNIQRRKPNLEKVVKSIVTVTDSS